MCFKDFADGGDRDGGYMCVFDVYTIHFSVFLGPESGTGEEPSSCWWAAVWKRHWRKRLNFFSHLGFTVDQKLDPLRILLPTEIG